tara:strand:- start:190 stop:375 length:186 start_codon:yes stop_codon:yes gene_type:complete
MTKTEAIRLLGGTHQTVKAALGYKSVQAVYQWPETLPASIERQVIGYLYKPQFDKKRAKAA